LIANFGLSGKSAQKTNALAYSVSYSSTTIITEGIFDSVRLHSKGRLLPLPTNIILGESNKMINSNEIVFIMIGFQFRETAGTTSTRRRGKVERRKDWRSVPGNAGSKDKKLFCVTASAPK
jgi:hypothetical protein